MTDLQAPTPLSRRRLLTEGVVAGGVALATASCAVGNPDPSSPKDGAIEAPKVDRVPADDPNSRTWLNGYPMRIALDGQTMANPQRPLPSQPTITVRAIHDGTNVGFKIEWADSHTSTTTAEANAFRDAVAVMLLPRSSDEALRTMGSATSPATILQWKADWQRQVDGDMQNVPEAFPNASVDYYPPLVKVEPKAVTAKSYQEANATQWLPGMHVGNLNASSSRTSPVEKLTARSFGTLKTCATQNCTGKGVHEDGKWVATLVKPFAATDPDELALAVSTTYTCAFAMWTGNENDSGSKKSPSKTIHVLSLEPGKS